jgi:hypothetical protein
LGNLREFELKFEEAMERSGRIWSRDERIFAGILS